MAISRSSNDENTVQPLKAIFTMATNSRSLLDVLRSESRVDCDTMDVKVAETLGPFVDCTSNQAIAFGELQKQEHESLIKDSLILSRKMRQKHEIAVSEAVFVSEIMMVKLSIRMVPHLTGFVHTQTNPYYSYSTEKTIENAKRIINIYRTVDPEFDISRVCIKIPSTWEGLQACRILESQGIATLATTLFSMEQAVVAADVGCTYIAPYVNELKVHFEAGYVDQDKGFELCRSAQRYYATLPHCKTQVLPASLTTIAEVMQLSGADHITISPPLLAELAVSSADLLSTTTDSPISFFKQPAATPNINDYGAIMKDEAAYRIAYTRSKAGANEAKLTQAINIFCDMQDGLEELAQKYRTLI